MFVNEYLIKDAGSCIKIEDTYAAFKEWYSNEFNEKAPIRREFKSYTPAGLASNSFSKLC